MENSRPGSTRHTWYLLFERNEYIETPDLFELRTYGHFMMRYGHVVDKTARKLDVLMYNLSRRQVRNESYRECVGNQPKPYWGCKRFTL